MTTTRLAAIVLAAGEASRFRAAAGADGPATKLVALHDGKPLVRHVVDAAFAAGLAPVVVVTGHARESVEQALAGADVAFIHNPDYASGMASSLKTGLVAVGDVDAALVLLGDMPLVSPALIATLIEAFARKAGAVAAMPSHDGVRGNPVLLSSALFADILQLQGDAGARQILRGRDADVVEVEVDDLATRLDVDTPDALRALQHR